MKKLFLIMLALGLVIVACKEESLVDDNPAPTSNNIDITFVPFYGDSAIAQDSIYTNRFGEEFYIDSVVFVMSDIGFLPVNSDDTIESESNYALFETGASTQKVGYLPADGYNGQFYIKAGIDSSDIFDFIGGNGPDFLTRLSRPLFGYNHFMMYGRMFDPTDPFDTTANTPLAYEIGTSELVDTIYSSVRAFSVDNTKDVIIILTCDLKPALNAFSLFLRPVIESNPTDNQDFAAARRFSDSLKFGIF